ncbi:nuclear transport factor 2 family protein [Mesorhizobium sp. CAU 1741]|uniref:nuclear transport factor 2 family protein n=1 Tax=Mesorhizobium sp. CAU 1741 TaxID=3140366 RepID=UPI00325B8CC1
MNRAADLVLITQLAQAWGLYRDQGLWPALMETFTDDGRISVSWFEGTIHDFIDRCRATHKAISPRGKHLIGTPLIRVQGDRATAEMNVQILGRATFSGIAVDNTSYARFVDRVIRTERGWRIVERVAVYEKDRLDPVVPSAAFDRFMSETDFSDIPEAYRYLGYRLRQTGRQLRPDIVVDGSPEADALLANAHKWLSAD